MNAKDALKAVSEKLEPGRKQFAIGLYQKSAKLVEIQALNQASLFWQLPNHVLVNLEGLLGGDTAKLNRFFRQAHSRRHHVARKALKESCADETEQFEETLTSAYQPLLGSLDSPSELPALDRRKLTQTIVQEGRDLFQLHEPSDPNELGTERFRVNIEPWYVRVSVEFGRALSQVSVDCNACIGLGPLSLEKQLCLYSILGIGPLGCDLAEPGQETQVARVLVGQTRVVVELLKDVLKTVDAGVSIEEVNRVERAWVESFHHRHRKSQ